MKSDGATPAFIPDETTLDGLYALGFSPDDVFGMEREAVINILARGETKAERMVKLGVKPKPKPTPRAKPAKAKTKPAVLTQDEAKAAEVWALGKSPIHDVVDRYLRARGAEPFANPPPPCVRIAPTLHHGPSENFLPSLMFKLTDPKTGAETTTVHAIFLEPGGRSKAKFKDGSGHSATMNYGSLNGGVFKLAEAIPGQPVVLAEGFETGVTIWQATGLPVWVTCGTAGLASFTPPEDVKWIIAAGENDAASAKAVKKLRQKLEPLGVRFDVAKPPVGAKEGEISDFNDMVNGRGVDQRTGMPFVRDEGLRRIKEIFAQTISGERGKASEDDTEAFSMTKTGLWRRSPDGVWRFVAQPFEVLGLARSASADGKVSSWGRLIGFDNPDGARIEEVVASAALQGDPATVAAALADAGMTIEATGPARRSFVQYLNGVDTKARITLALRTGWVAVGGKRAFIVPGAVIGGDPNERVILTKEVNAAYEMRGSLSEWRDNVATPAADHLMLRFAISLGFGGTMLAVVGGESGVIHIYGPSSGGKTTASRVSASVWGSGGDAGYLKTWKSTSNALEGNLAASTDSLLVLDEVGQAEAREIGQMLYMITNARGKDRMTRTVTIRSAFKWRTLVLSTGEVPIPARLNEDSPRGGRKGVRAGHLVRAVDLKADRVCGVFDRPYPDFDPASFSDQLKKATATFCGVAGVEFVRQLLDRDVDDKAAAKKIDAFAEQAVAIVDGDPSGQVSRVIQRFALIAAAGEFAVEFGIVPWAQGVPTADALELFRGWLRARGGAGPAEERQMVAQVQRFWELHGESRFDNLDTPPTNPFTGQEMKERPSSQRAGYREGKGDDRRWFTLPQTWRDEVCIGLDAMEVARTLARRGILERGDGKNLMKRVSIGSDRLRAYVITPKVFEGWDAQDARPEEEDGE